MTNDSIVFNSDDNTKTLRISLQYYVDDYFTFIIKVKSGPFAGESSFCMSKKMVIAIIDKLFKMHKDLEGVCKIEDCDSDAYLTIKMEKLGHLFLDGQIGGSHQDHYMKFKYAADQTILLNLIKVFKTAL